MPVRASGLRPRRRRGGSVGGGEGGGFTPNLPSGLSPLFDTSFETAFPVDINTLYEGLPLKVYIAGATQDNVSYGHGSKSLRVDYPEGSLGGGTGPGQLITDESNVLNWRRCYFSLRMRLSDNYRIHPVSEKWFFPVLNGGTEGGSGGRIDFSNSGWAGDSNNGDFTLVVTPGAGQTSITVASTIDRGVARTWEYFCYLNDPSVANGIVRIWKDGVLVAERTDCQLYGGASQKYFQYLEWPFIRGGGNDTVAVPAGGQSIWYDRLACYGSTT